MRKRNIIIIAIVIIIFAIYLKPNVAVIYFGTAQSKDYGSIIVEKKYFTKWKNVVSGFKADIEKSIQQDIFIIDVVVLPKI